MERTAATADFLRFRQTGDPGALERALTGVRPALAKQARALVGHEADAADLLQETLLIAVQRSDQFRQEASLESWLRGISRHLVHKQWRRRTPELGLSSVIADEIGPAAAAEREQLHSHMHDAVRRLPRAYREVMQLYLAGETSPLDMAAQLQRSPSTVRTQLERGLRRLRDLLPRSLAPLLVATVVARSGTAAAPAGTQSWRRRHVATVGAVTGALLLGALGLLWWGAGQSSSPVPTAAPLGGPTAATSSADTNQLDATRTSIPAPADRNSVATATVEVVLRWASTNEPAANVAVVLAAPAWPGTRPLIVHFDTWRRATTDTTGIARFTDVPAGPAQVRVDDFDVLERLEVAAGADLRVASTVRRATEMTGRVHDPDGNPVADADVWLSSSGRVMTPGYIVATTDAEGRYRAPVFSRLTQLVAWAEAVGYRPSSSVRPDASTASSNRDFMLRRNPRTVTGLLLDPNGQGVHGVLAFYPSKLANRSPPTLYVQSDASGRFTCAALDPIGYRIAGAAQGLAGVALDIDLATADTELELRLQQGVVVWGMIHGIDPAATERLRVGARWPSAMRAGPEQFLLLPATTVASDGSYRIGPMPTGAMVLGVFDPHRREGLIASHELAIPAAGALRCDLFASSHPGWRIRVHTPTGKPARGVTVGLAHPADRPEAGEYSSIVPTDADGWAIFQAPPEQPLDVLVLAEASAMLPLAYRARVHPGADLHVQLPTESAQPQARVAGRLVRLTDIPDTPATLRLRHVASGLGREQALVPDRAEFAFDDVPAGQYALEVRLAQPPHAVARLAECSVPASGQVDLGDLALPTWARVHVSTPATNCPTPLAVHVRDSIGHLVANLQVPRGEQRAFALPAGPLRFEFFDTRIQRQSTELTTSPGGGNELSIEPGTGRSCRIRFPFDPKTGRDAVTIGHVEIRSATGQATMSLEAVYSSTSHFAVRTILQPGEYDVTFVARWNRPQTRRIRVRDGSGIQDFDLPLVRR